MEKRDLYLVGTQLQHGTPGSTDMQPFDEVDLGSFYSQVQGAISTASLVTIGLIADYAPVTATADGTGTGTIVPPTAGSSRITFVSVTSDNADKIVVLPSFEGTEFPYVVVLVNGSTGYELRTSTPATISINGGAEANAESAIAANTVVVMFWRSATAWVGFTVATDGTVAAVTPAAAA